MRTGTPSTSPSVKRARSPRRNGGKPQCATSASANQKPALCRVAAYSGPGLPRPTTARKRQLSLPPLGFSARSEEHTSELQSQSNLVCRLLLEKKNIDPFYTHQCYRRRAAHER